MLSVPDTQTSTPEAADHPVPKHKVASGERTIVFTDAVVAIAITLLALDLPLPAGTTSGELWHSVGEHSAEYRSFLISFLVIWALWAAHRELFSHVSGGVDKWLSWMNGMWLLTIVINPFATKILSPNDDAFPLRFGFYALIICVSSLLFLLMNLRIQRAGLLRPGTPPGLMRDMALRSGILIVCFAISIPVALFTQLAYLCWLAVPIVDRLVEPVLSRRKAI